MTRSTTKALPWLAALTVLALLCALGCAHAPDTNEDAPPEEVRPQDVVWRDLEAAFTLLRSADAPGALDDARTKLEGALASFEDLATPSNLDVAFAKDRDMPYRGRPHERVLAALTLALLDIHAGRCDLALPTLRTAALLDVRWQAPDPTKGVAATDVPFIHALELRCLDAIGAAAPDRERARKSLEDSFRVRLPDDQAKAEARALDEAMRGERIAIWLAGVGPTIALEGRHDETSVVRPGRAPETTPPAIARCDLTPTPDGGLVIGLCRDQPANDAPFPVAATRPVWSSTEQATTVHERRFSRVLEGRAVFKDVAKGASTGLSSLGTEQVRRGLSSLARCAPSKNDDNRGGTCVQQAAPQLTAGGVLLASAGALLGAALLTKPSADDRYVASLFETGTLLVGDAPETVAHAPADVTEDTPKRP